VATGRCASHSALPLVYEVAAGAGFRSPVNRPVLPGVLLVGRHPRTSLVTDYFRVLLAGLAPAGRQAS